MKLLEVIVLMLQDLKIIEDWKESLWKPEGIPETVAVDRNKKCHSVLTTFQFSYLHHLGRSAEAEVFRILHQVSHYFQAFWYLRGTRLWAGSGLWIWAFL
jgi:hypothetical protein